MKSFRIGLVSILAIFVLGVNVNAQDEQPPPEQRAPITTDRPTFTTDSNMMTPGEYQLELGYTYTDVEHGDSSNFPETLFRYGYNTDWELRIGWDGYDFGGDDGDFAKGMSVGYKKKLKEAGEHKWIKELDDFSMALISTYTLPTGNVPDDVETLTIIGWNYQIDERTSLAGNLGFGSLKDIETTDRFIQGLTSIVVSRMMGDDTSVFGEFYTNVPAADDQDAEYVIQSGFLHRFSNDSQFDFRLGVGLNNQAPDWLLGVGFASKFKIN